MPNTIGANGVTVATRAELLAQYTLAFQNIYGVDINVAQDTPDGQMINLFLQSVLDLEDLLVQINNQFDPDLAFGKILDQRVAINGIQRQAGTYTVTNVTITVTQALTLFGLDQSVEQVYTVADNAGNQWNLQTTIALGAPGSYALAFQAANPGAVLTTPNTITVPVTVVLGVSGINNPTTYTTLGLNEETDAALKIRRQKSVSIASQGYLAGLLADLENIPGVSSAYVYENTTNAVDANGVSSHSIWVIIAGGPTDADVANAIYRKRNAGCGMYNTGGIGAKDYIITQVDGSPFLVRWDSVIAEILYIKFDVSSLDGVNQPDIAGIRSGLVTDFVPGVAEQVNINDLACIVQNIDPNALVTNAGFSLSPLGPFTPTLTPSGKNKQFAVSEPNIIILPMLMNPAVLSIAPLGVQQFTALGGYGAILFTMLVNNSGGSVSPTGLYTAGAVSGIDTIRATDSQGHTVDANITVT